MGTYKIQKETNNENQNNTTGTSQNHTLGSTSNTATTGNSANIQTSVNNIPVIKKPLQFTIPQVDISKIQGHLCTEGKSFKMIREELPNLSGAYYQTDRSGNEEWLKIQGSKAPSDVFGQTKYRTSADGSTEVLNFFNYGEGHRFVDMTFDPAQNVFYVEKKLRFARYKVYDKAGKELAYDHDKMKDKDEDNFNFEMQAVTADDIAFLKDKETKVNQILNHMGYYITASRCNRADGCLCKIPIVLKVKYEFSTAMHDVIRLFDDSNRANSGNYPMVERIKGKNTTIKNGTKITTDEIWEIDTTVVFAHETGHHFGFPDEYFIGGGSVHKMYIDPKTLLIDVKKPEPKNDWKRYSGLNLMSANGVHYLPQIPAYYYEVFRKKFEQKTGIEMEIKC